MARGAGSVPEFLGYFIIAKLLPPLDPPMLLIYFLQTLCVFFFVIVCYYALCVCSLFYADMLIALPKNYQFDMK